MKSGAKRKTFIDNMITYGTVVAVYVVMQILAGTGHVSSLMKGLLVPLCIYVAVVVSLDLTVGIPSELDLGHARFMCMGASVGALFSKCMREVIDPTLGMVITIIIGAVTAIVFGILIDIPILRLRGDYLAIVTLAFGEIVENLVNAVYLERDTARFHISSRDSMPLNPEEGGEVLIEEAQGITGTPQTATSIIGVILALVTLFMVTNLMNSRVGHVIMMIRDSRIATESTGINITEYKLPAFSVSAGLTDVAGVLYTHNLTTLVTLPKNLRYNVSIMVLVYVVLGSIGSIQGSVIATATLYLLPEMLRRFSNYRMLTYIVVLILVILSNSALQFVIIHKYVVERFDRKDKNPAKRAT